METVKNKILKVGITGGIGSGKSTLCKVFEKLGIPVYYADAKAKLIVETDSNVISEIKKTFGNDLYDSNGIYNRKRMAELVFNNEFALQKLNAIIHPAVFRDFAYWHSLQSSVAYTLKEAAIMFESGANKDMDAVINVTCPEILRISRVCLRDNISPETVKLRMKSQLTDDERTKLSDYNITNDDVNLVIPQILKIHQILIENPDLIN